MTNDTQVLTLTDFLLARIAEDEAGAMRRERRTVVDGSGLLADAWSVVGDRRVLAECEAKRRIVGMYVGPTEDDEGNPYAVGGYGEAWLDAIRFLALPYADHPDYNPDWRP